MSGRQPRYSKEEHARRGAALYEQDVRPRVEAGNHGRIVAIDVDTEIFELADDTLTASRRLLARCPEAQIWCVRIGHPAVHRFGPLCADMMTGLSRHNQ
jgi:hypothetical protein